MRPRKRLFCDRGEIPQVHWLAYDYVNNDHEHNHSSTLASMAGLPNLRTNDGSFEDGSNDPLGIVEQGTMTEWG
jgi:hypothetical protein